MNKFWQWMKEKGYAEWDSSCNVFWPPHFAGRDLHCINNVSPFTPQMLIGYKLEYVRDHAFWKESDGLVRYNVSIDLAILWKSNNMNETIDAIIAEIEAIMEDKETP